jgi:hypothetical protein
MNAMTEIIIHLPETLAKEAAVLGLLTNARMETLLRAEIQAQLRAMAEDSAILREIQQIDAEFRSTETDGLAAL